MDDSNHLVSIIVPVYNAAEFIDFAVQSLLSQTYSNIEVILVNDGSKDNSKELCARWERKDPRVKFFDKENGGTASARNLGVKNAKGEYIQYLDADDYISQDKIAEQLQFMLENDLDVSFSDSANFYYNLTDAEAISKHSSVWLISFQTALYFRWGIDFSIPIHAFLYKRSFLVDNNILLFNNKIRYREDWNYHINVSKAKPKILKLPKVMAYYRHTETSKTSNWQAITKGNILFIESRDPKERIKFIPRLSMELWLLLFRCLKYRTIRVELCFIDLSKSFYPFMILSILIMPVTIIYVLYRNVMIYFFR